MAISRLSAPPFGNRLLDRLPKMERAQLLRSAETISLPHGHEVYRQGGPISHVYFPKSGSICLLVLMEDGRAIDAASVGNEGMIGTPVFLGPEESPMTTIVQLPGQSLRIATFTFLQALRTCATLTSSCGGMSPILLGQRIKPSPVICCIP
jgi:CRP-like cAMP-binding protein